MLVFPGDCRSIFTWYTVSILRYSTDETFFQRIIKQFYDWQIDKKLFHLIKSWFRQFSKINFMKYTFAHMTCILLFLYSY